MKSTARAVRQSVWSPVFIPSTLATLPPAAGLGTVLQLGRFSPSLCIYPHKEHCPLYRAQLTLFFTVETCGVPELPLRLQKYLGSTPQCRSSETSVHLHGAVPQESMCALPVHERHCVTRVGTAHLLETVTMSRGKH